MTDSNSGYFITDLFNQTLPVYIVQNRLSTQSKTDSTYRLNNLLKSPHSQKWEGECFIKTCPHLPKWEGKFLHKSGRGSIPPQKWEGEYAWSSGPVQ